MLKANNVCPLDNLMMPWLKGTLKRILVDNKYSINKHENVHEIIFIQNFNDNI